MYKSTASILLFQQPGCSSGTFVSASEDETGVLDLIEKKIARATMLPQTHGEVCFVIKLLFVQLPQLAMVLSTLNHDSCQRQLHCCHRLFEALAFGNCQAPWLRQGYEASDPLK